jgi:hypothetical protein
MKHVKGHFKEKYRQKETSAKNNHSKSGTIYTGEKRI